MIAAQPDATFVHGGVVGFHSAATPESSMVSASGHKRKASANLREAADQPVARQRGVQEDNGTLASLAGQIVRAVVPSASTSEQVVELADAAVSMNDQPRVRTEAKSTILHSDQPVPKNGGGTMKLPIVIHDDDDENLLLPAVDTVLGEGNGCWPCPEPEPAQLAFEDNELTNPFGYSTWDPTDGGRYKLLSTYLPPPCLDPDEEDAQRAAAALRSSSLYLSPADIFWGTPDGVWTPY